MTLRRLMDGLIARAVWEHAGNAHRTPPYERYRGKEIPEQYLPGRMIMNLKPEERELLKELKPEHLQPRADSLWC